LSEIKSVLGEFFGLMDIEREKEIVKSCLKGEPDAWEIFVETYQRLIYSCIYKILNRYARQMDLSKVEDLFQTVFLSFIKDDYQKLRGFSWKNKSSIATWISVVTRNLVLDFLRKERKQKVTQSLNCLVDESSKTELMDLIAGKEESPDKVLNSADEMEILKKAIAELPKKDILLVELLFFQEMTHQRVAIILDKSVDAIYMQKKRIIQKLETKIKNSVRSF